MIRRVVHCVAILLLAGCAAQPTTVPRPASDPVQPYRAPGPDGDPWGPFIHAAAAEFGVPEPLIYAVIWAESRGCQWLNGRPIGTGTGLAGLMQIPPSVYDQLGKQIALGPDPYLPRDNIRAGTYELSQLIRQFGLPGALAAYQFGDTSVLAARKAGRPLPRPTRTYQRDVWANYQGRLSRQAHGADWRGPDQVACTWPGH